MHHRGGGAAHTGAEPRCNAKLLCAVCHVIAVQVLMLLIVAAPAIRMRAAPPRDFRMCATPDVSRKDRNTLSRRAASLGAAS